MKRMLPLALGAVILLALVYAGTERRQHLTAETQSVSADRIPATVVGPEGTEIRWLLPESAQELGTGAEVRMMVDHVTVPHASLGAFVITTTATGILVHAHVWQAEMIYVISGEGVALVGDNGQDEVALESGSALYVPERAWHGFRNTDPDNRLKLLIITRPTAEGGLADFFRAAARPPGEDPLDLSPEEFVRLLETHGMEVPPPEPDE